MRRLDRRTALGLLIGAGLKAATLKRFFGDARGTAVLLDLRAHKVIAAHAPELARRWLIPPGSTLKPFSLTALLESGKLRADEQFPCPIQLLLAGRSFACSHPPTGVPMRAETAIAYSCNNFVAHFAKRFEADELARVLTRERLASRSGLLGADEALGRVQPGGDVVDRQLQAIGEARVLVTPVGLLAAYSALASKAAGPILEGLEGAVEYGTAQLAAVRGVKVAGKTGTVITSSGVHVVWFAGFAPSRAPEVAVVVAAQGRSGAMDAAPIAGRILGAKFEGKL
jgi:cell division protein FtsI/penicillin-binding protein 2